MLTFDEAAHRYEWNGKVVPSVTQLLAPLSDFSRIDPAVLENARQQGVAVHKLVELDTQGDLDLASLPEWMIGYHGAWAKFCADTGFVAIGSEQRVYDRAFGYAGTLDLVGTMHKGKHAPDRAIVDVKRSFLAGPSIGLQTAAYLNAWNVEHPKQKAKYRFALQLRADGSYRLQPFEDPADFGVFLSLLTLHKYKARNGLH